MGSRGSEGLRRSDYAQIEVSSKSERVMDLNSAGTPESVAVAGSVTRFTSRASEVRSSSLQLCT